MKRFLLMLFIVIFTVSIILIEVGCKEEAAESATQETTITEVETTIAEEVTQESKEPEINDTTDTTLPTKELQWRWQNPRPDGNILNSVWCSSPTDVFAVGENGLILHFDGNSDKLWTPMISGTTAYLFDVWGSSSSDVFAVGVSYDSTTKQSKPVILHYNGTSWSEIDTGMTVGSLNGVWGSASNDVFVVGGD